MTSTHYGNSQNPESLFPWARKMAQNITRRYLRNGDNILPILAYRGMSGVATATAIMAFIPAKYQDAVGMMYIRKPDEKSHGSEIEHTINITSSRPTRHILIICDDFIDDGDTVTTIATKAITRLMCDQFDIKDIHFALSTYNYDTTLRSVSEVFRKVYQGEEKYENFNANCEGAIGSVKHLRESLLS